MASSTDVLMSSTPTISLEDWINYLDHLSEESWRNRQPVVVYLIFTLVAGVIGNIAVLMVYWIKYRPSATRVFILTMAIFDLLTSILGIPFQLLTIRFAYNSFNLWTCRGFFMFSTLFSQSSGVILVVVAMDRYHRICRPLKRHLTAEQAWKVVAVSASASCAIFALFTPLYGQHTVPTNKPGVNATMCWVHDSFRDTGYLEVYTFFVWLFFVPGTVIMVGAYVLIALQIWTRRSRTTSSYIHRSSEVASSEADSPDHENQKARIPEFLVDMPETKEQRGGISGCHSDKPGNEESQRRIADSYADMLDIDRERGDILVCQADMPGTEESQRRIADSYCNMPDIDSQRSDTLSSSIVMSDNERKRHDIPSYHVETFCTERERGELSQIDNKRYGNPSYNIDSLHSNRKRYNIKSCEFDMPHSGKKGCKISSCQFDRPHSEIIRHDTSPCFLCHADMSTFERCDNLSSQTDTHDIKEERFLNCSSNADMSHTEEGRKDSTSNTDIPDSKEKREDNTSHPSFSNTPPFVILHKTTEVTNQSYSEGFKINSSTQHRSCPTNQSEINFLTRSNNPGPMKYVGQYEFSHTTYDTVMTSDVHKDYFHGNPTDSNMESSDSGMGSDVKEQTTSTSNTTLSAEVDKNSDNNDTKARKSMNSINHMNICVSIESGVNLTQSNKYGVQPEAEECASPTAAVSFMSSSKASSMTVVANHLSALAGTLFPKEKPEDTKKISCKFQKRFRSRTTLMMGILTVFYIINWLPHLISRTVNADPSNQCLNMTDCGWNIYGLSLRSFYLNSAANAFIYSFCNQRFRHQCWRLITRR